MTENKNHNHTFSSDVNIPLYLIRIGSLYPLFCFFRWWWGELWSYVHHTVDVKILCADVVRPSGCRFIFSVHAIFDDPVSNLVTLS